MRISGTMLASVILLTASVTYSIAEDLTLTTYYPSPRGVYSEVLANRFYDFNAGPTVPDPDKRFLEPDGTSQLQSVQFSGSLTLGGQSISTWEQALPLGLVLMYASGSTCPSGFTKLDDVNDLGRFPLIAATAGGVGGSILTGEGDAVTMVSVPGVAAVQTDTHHHPFMPRYREFVFCQRN